MNEMWCMYAKNGMKMDAFDCLIECLDDREKE